MFTYGGARHEHFDAASHFDSRAGKRVGFKIDRLVKTLLDAAAVLVGLALVIPCLLVLFSPLIAAVMD